MASARITNTSARAESRGLRRHGKNREGSADGLARWAGGAGDRRRLGDWPGRCRALCRGGRAGRGHGPRRRPRRSAEGASSATRWPRSPAMSTPARRQQAGGRADRRRLWPARHLCRQCRGARRLCAARRHAEDKLAAACDELFAINVKGCILGAKAALPELTKTEGCMIFTASGAGFTSAGGGVIYTASKHAVVGIIRQLAVELGPRIRVNGVAPGGTMTDLRSVAALSLEDRSQFAVPGTAERIAPATRCNWRSNRPISRAPMCFWPRAPTPAASPADRRGRRRIDPAHAAAGLGSSGIGHAHEMFPLARTRSGHPRGRSCHDRPIIRGGWPGRARPRGIGR